MKKNKEIKIIKMKNERMKKRKIGKKAQGHLLIN